MSLRKRWVGEAVLGLFLLGLAAVFGGFRPILRAMAAQKSIVPGVLTGEYDSRDVGGVFHGQMVASSEVFPSRLAMVLGQSSGAKRIEVDLTNQRLYAYEGEEMVFNFPVSTGKWYPTPTGTFKIWGKFRYTKMSGGNPVLSTYYYLPNVPFVMFFANDVVSASRGFSLHGTYWHNNFGHPMSHGCVNVRTEDAGTLFYWTDPSVGEGKTVRANDSNPGTEVRIYGEAPKE